MVSYYVVGLSYSRMSSQFHSGRQCYAVCLLILAMQILFVVELFNIHISSD